MSKDVNDAIDVIVGIVEDLENENDRLKDDIEVKDMRLDELEGELEEIKSRFEL